MTNENSISMAKYIGKNLLDKIKYIKIYLKRIKNEIKENKGNEKRKM